jgi:hypothetical protein
MTNSDAVQVAPLTIPPKAQWLAYALPCRRFAHVLANIDTRLRVDVDRTSFIPVDLHHHLLAGLPARSP